MLTFDDKPIAHGRHPFAGEREVDVVSACPVSRDDA